MARIKPSPARRSRLVTPFTKEQSSWVIIKYGEVKSHILVRRAFRNKFFPENPRQVPALMAFSRLISRFEKDAAIRPQAPSGTSPTYDRKQDCQKVKMFFRNKKKAHIREASQTLNMSVGKIWTILRKDLGWKPYRPITVQMLNPNNMEARLAACQFWLTFPTSWFDQQVIWSDEKWFVLIKAPNKKNSVCWAPANPHNLVQCKKQGGKKVMVDGGWEDLASLLV